MQTSYNGWPASTLPVEIHVEPFVVAGVTFPHGVRRGDVATVLGHVMQQFHDRVEPLVSPGCWGYDYRPDKNDPTKLSCHASATAVDANAPQHPNGIEAAHNFTRAQIDEIHTILAEIPELDEVVHWGGDWHYADGLTPDPMHFEIHNHDTAKLARVAQRIEEVDMAISDADVAKIAAAVLAQKVETIAADGTRQQEHFASVLRSLKAGQSALLRALAETEGLTPDQLAAIQKAIAEAAVDVDVTVHNQTGA
jgi:hypothetical protein